MTSADCIIEICKYHAEYGSKVMSAIKLFENKELYLVDGSYSAPIPGFAGPRGFSTPFPTSDGF